MAMEFKVGQVLNFSWNGAFGRLIKLNNYLTYGYSKENKYTHSAIIGEIKGEDVTIYEAVSNGFTKRTFPKSELECYISTGNLIIGEVQEKLIYVKKNCEKYIGVPYGKLDIVKIGINTMLRLVKLNMIQFKSTKNMICSEAVCQILYDSSKKKINFEPEFNKTFDSITPMDLYYSTQINWRK